MAGAADAGWVGGVDEKGTVTVDDDDDRVSQGTIFLGRPGTKGNVRTGQQVHAQREDATWGKRPAFETKLAAGSLECCCANTL